MADENQKTPRVGPVSQNQPGQQPGQPNVQQQAPQRGVPGVQQPPVPSAEKIAEVMRKQQEEQARQVAEARARQEAIARGESPVPVAASQAEQQHTPSSRIGQAAAGESAPQQAQPQQAQPQESSEHEIPAHIRDQMPPEMRQAVGKIEPKKVPADQANTASPVPGMSAQEVLAGPQRPQEPPVQYAPAPQPQFNPNVQPYNGPQQYAPPVPQHYAPQQQAQPQQARYAQQQQEIVKPKIYWHPARSRGVDVELEDSIVKCVPEKGMVEESDPQARVVLALFSEILAVKEMAAGGAAVPPDLMNRMAGIEHRLQRLEMALYEQTQAMTQRARGVREQIEILQAKGMNADQILAELNGISQAAEQQVAQPQTQAPPPGEPGGGE